MAIIGIDLGTTNSLVCVYQDGQVKLIPNSFGDYKTPSVVHIKGNQVQVGKLAKNMQVLQPKNTAASFKVWMGTEKEIYLDGKTFLPEELSAFVLKQLVQDAEAFLGEPVTEAIISVPAYFNDNQRCATKMAAQIAGLKVDRLVNEPSAAALYYQTAQQKQDGVMMIVDFGGGTLDVSIVEAFQNIIEIVSVAGDNHLGGNDIDLAIVEYFCSQNDISPQQLSPEAYSGLLHQAEQAKIALSNQMATMMVLAWKEKECSLILTRETLSEICQPIFQRITKVIQQAIKNASRRIAVDDVVMVGGSAQLTVLSDFLEEKFRRRPYTAPSPDQTIALGVGLYAGIKERAEEVQDLVMTDVCPFSLGVAVYNRKDETIPHMSFLIHRSTTLPAVHTERYWTLQDGQERITFRIYQGENYYAEQNLKLGEISVSVPADLAGKSWADICFAYDINGILCVSAKSCNGEVQEQTILNPKLKLNSKEMQRAQEKLKEMQLQQQTVQTEEQALMEKLIRLYETSSIALRQYIIEGWIEQYQQALESKSPIIKKRALQEISQQVERLQEVQESEISLSEIWKEQPDFDDSDIDDMQEDWQEE